MIAYHQTSSPTKTIQLLLNGLLASWMDGWNDGWVASLVCRKDEWFDSEVVALDLIFSLVHPKNKLEVVFFFFKNFCNVCVIE